MTAEQLRDLLIEDADSVIGMGSWLVGRDKKRRALACRAFLKDAGPEALGRLLSCYQLFSHTPEEDMSDTHDDATFHASEKSKARCEEAAKTYGLDASLFFALLAKYGPAVLNLILAILEEVRAPQYQQAAKASHECSDEVRQKAKDLEHAAIHQLCAAHCLAHCCGCHDETT
jgi:hypothetical protein